RGLPADDSGNEGAAPPVSPQDIEALRRRIESERRSQAELVFDDHRESGDLNSRLEYERYGFRLALRRDGPALLASATRTPYRTTQGLLAASGTNLTVGGERRVGDSVETHAELGVTHFDGGATSVGGQAAVTVRPSEKLRYSAGVARTNVEESFLSAVGI